MIRHPDNTNLILHNGSTFQSRPIQEDKGTFIQQYLLNNRECLPSESTYERL